MPVIIPTVRDSTHAKRLPPFPWSHESDGTFPSDFPGLPWESAFSGIKWPKATASSGGIDTASTPTGTVLPSMTNLPSSSLPPSVTRTPLSSPSLLPTAQSSKMPTIMVAVVLPLACLSIALSVLLFLFSRRKRHARRARLLQTVRPMDRGTTPFILDALSPDDGIPRESKYNSLKVPPPVVLNDGVTTPYIVDAIPVDGGRRERDTKYDILKAPSENVSSDRASHDRCPLMLDELHRAIQRTGLSVQAFFSSFLTPRPDAPAEASPPRYEA